MYYLLLVLFLSGCAINSQQAQSMSDYSLCRKYAAPLISEESRIVVHDEIYRRGIDCSAVWQQQNIQRQQALQMLQQGNYMMQQQPTQTDCRTTCFGNACNTTCR